MPIPCSEVFWLVFKHALLTNDLFNPSQVILLKFRLKVSGSFAFKIKG